MLPSSPSADYISVCTFTALLRQSRFLLPAFPENRGARLRISGGCPARGEPEALIDLCSSIACRAQPCQRCSPVLQALIIFQYALLRLCFGRAVFCCLLFRRTGEHDCASPAVAPQGASRRRLLIFAQASRAKTKSMVLRLFCKLFVNPIDKVGGQEYIFSSRADRVLKIKTNCSVGGAQNHEEEHRYNSITALPPLGTELLAKNLSVR